MDQMTKSVLTGVITAVLTALVFALGAYFSGWYHKTINKWPEGTYGILAHGECPKGWDRKEGFIHGIYIHDGTDRYLRRQSFGDSEIDLHNPVGINVDRNTAGPHGDIHLSACFKINSE